MIGLPAALFWAYAIGSTFALSAARQLHFLERRAADRTGLPRLLAPRLVSRAANPYLCLTLLYAAVLLVPTGLFLMWQNPSWSTMHIADGHRGVWAGLPLLYAGGVVTATLLGFLLAQALCLVGAGYWAYLNCAGGHFLLFGTLVHGWDGQGYRRFLSTDGAALRAWPGDSVINNVLRFLTSGTFLALLVLGAAVLGTMLLAEIGWLAEGWLLPGGAQDLKVPRVLAVAIAGAGLYGLPLAGALLASALVRFLGFPVGLTAFAAVTGGLLLPRRSPVRWLYGLVGLPKGHWRATADLLPENRAAARP
ncbi:hypothetical protein ACH4FX_20620 [Streptomyces sp. NPDC018019]|uniref:hypothetical protein n=1 Tax=Streptomyces sp. NPDC018019 TaxID=3365030 RepID=UPI0037A12335